MTLLPLILASLILLIIGIAAYMVILYASAMQVKSCFRCPFMQGKTCDEHESESIG